MQSFFGGTGISPEERELLERIIHKSERGKSPQFSIFFSLAIIHNSHFHRFY